MWKGWERNTGGKREGDKGMNGMGGGIGQENERSGKRTREKGGREIKVRKG
jgi:hypothetical protein